jgi:hypothetical protein
MCAALALGLLVGCATDGPATDGGCAWARPIYISRADALSEGTAGQIEAHNETGARVCGWKRSGKGGV